jgi:hypothetical protein
MFDLSGAQYAVRLNYYTAGTPDGIKRDYGCQRLIEVDDHPVIGLHAGLSQRSCKSDHQPGQFPIAHIPLTVDNRDIMRISRCGRKQRVFDTILLRSRMFADTAFHLVR